MATAQDIETAAEALVTAQATTIAARNAYDIAKALVDSDVSTEYNAMLNATDAYQAAFNAAKGGRNLDSFATAFNAALAAEDAANETLRGLAQEFLNPT